MIMASTKRYGCGVGSQNIYTRARQAEYKTEIHRQATEEKVSANKMYAVMFLVAVLLFCSCFGMIFFKSIISGVQIQINEVNEEIRTLEQENSQLQADMINAVDIQAIKESAESMGMSLPESYQIEYVDTAETSASLKVID